MTPVRPAMTHREVLQAMSGLLLAIFVVTLSGTIVANALPRIVVDLDGSQSQYTWVVTAALLTLTVTGPIWGKLADRTNRKSLVQLAISIFVAGSVLAGLSPSIESLIVFRALEGLGTAGVVALAEIVMASMVSPRERGRYMGYFGAVGAVATVGGPLVGGFVVDAPLLGWRWCFWLGVPFAVAAWILLDRTLHLPVPAAGTRIDWWGAALVPGGVGVLLVWVTLVGGGFGWFSWDSGAFLGAGTVLIVLAVLVERRAADPIVPPRLLRRRTMLAATVASAAVGVALVGSSVYFAQYFQVARGFTPTQSGLLMVPMLAAIVLATTVSGRLVARTGQLRGPLVAGAALIVAGLALLATIGSSTPLAVVCSGMAVAGLGIGACLPNLLLSVQNSLSYRDLGAGTSTFTFFQSLGGAAGVAVLGAVFAAHLTGLIGSRLASLPGSHEVPDAGSASLDLAAMSPQVRAVVEQSYGDATALIFLLAAGVAVVAFVSVLFIREGSLRTTVDDEPDVPAVLTRSR